MRRQSTIDRLRCCALADSRRRIPTKSDQKGKALSGRFRTRTKWQPIHSPAAPAQVAPARRTGAALKWAMPNVADAKRGRRTPYPPRARKAIAAAAKRVARGTTLNRNHWQWVIEKNPLINEALEHQGQFTLAGAPRVRSRTFNMKSFCQDLSAVAMRAIQTDQFVDRDLVECLTLLAVRDPSEFAKFLALARRSKAIWRRGPMPRWLSRARR